MIREVVQADLGFTLFAALIGVAASAIPACLTALRQWLKRKDTKVTIKSGSIEMSFDLDDLNSKDVSSIIDALADKSDDRQAKT